MKMVHGRVENGQVVLDEPLPEGAVASGEQSFDLDEAEIAALRESIAEADRGVLVSLDDVLRVR